MDLTAVELDLTAVELVETETAELVEPAEAPEFEAASEPVADPDPPWFELIDALEVAAKAGLAPAGLVDSHEADAAPAEEGQGAVLPVEEDLPTGRRQRRRERPTSVRTPKVVPPPVIVSIPELFGGPVGDIVDAPAQEAPETASDLVVVKPSRRRWWRRSPVEDPVPAMDLRPADDVEGEDPDDFELVVDPAAAVAVDDLLEPVESVEAVEPVVHVDRRKARRARRRGGRRALGVPVSTEEDLLPVDPAAAVAAGVTEVEAVEAGAVEAVEAELLAVVGEPIDVDVNQIVEPEREPEPEQVPADTAEEPEEAASADFALPSVEVPDEVPDEFVRDFLRDVQHLVHGGVPTHDQVEAAEDRAGDNGAPAHEFGETAPRTKRAHRRTESSEPSPAGLQPVSQGRRDSSHRSTRLARYSLIVVLIGTSAALPWVVPEVPTWFASALPQGADTPTNPDPTIAPAPTPTGPTPTTKPGADLATEKLASAGRPLEVWVPRLKVRSPVVPISGQSGELVPPDDAQILGWWQEGRGAGAKKGSAVVTGHTVSTGGGAFDNLGRLTSGDRLRVRTSAGWITYAVERSRDYSVSALAKNAAEVFELGGEGRLVLITCSDFNGQVYLSNAVVFATPVGDEPFQAIGAADSPDAEVPDGGLAQPWDEPGGNTGADPGVQLTEKPF